MQSIQLVFNFWANLALQIIYSKNEIYITTLKKKNCDMFEQKICILIKSANRNEKKNVNK